MNTLQQEQYCNKNEQHLITTARSVIQHVQIGRHM